MCGFAGVVAFDRRFAVTRQTLAAMSARVAHRGPDGEGTFFDEPPSGSQVALAHRRLAILDPDPRSNQPFTDGRRWLVFNGEIYNFRDLRAELSPRDWKTTGDTEILLAAYDAWGEKCVNHFNGMFAFAIWDAPEKKLVLARDRMGQKPLYFAAVHGAISFASEIGALLPVEWVDRTIDDDALAEYLRWGYVPQRQTIYRGIRQISPGESRIVTADRNYGWWVFGLPFSSNANVVEGTSPLVHQAVQRQLVSDVPLGCFLSGGIDSSVIAASMCKAVGDPRKVLTFSIGFNDRRYDETKYAAAVAAHLGTEHRQFTVHPDAAADLPKIAAAFGQPMGDSSALPTHYLAQQTRQHVKVALSGDGGDELFGGYDRYRAMRMLAAGGKIPWRLLAPLIRALPGTHPKSAAARAKRLAAAATLPEAKRYSTFMRLFDDSLLPHPSGTDRIEQLYEQIRKKCGPVETAMAVDRATYLPDDLLAKVDHCSMLHALEVRQPFMDPDLVNFTQNLKVDDLLQGGPKRPLRLAFAADLPSWVFRRKKMGFAVPIGQWLRASLRPMLHDLLFSTDSISVGLFGRPALDAMVSDHQAKKQDHSQRLYALLMLELWRQAAR
jgi:asparagine synthase (glutamine-hydrolysing)